MTNFEKIKNMSVSELASECCKGLTCAFCPINEKDTYLLLKQD